jgi:hypothetical protein
MSKVSDTAHKPHMQEKLVHKRGTFHNLRYGSDKDGSQLNVFNQKEKKCHVSIYSSTITFYINKKLQLQIIYYYKAELRTGLSVINAYFFKEIDLNIKIFM